MGGGGGGGGLGWMGVEQEWSKGDAPVTALAPQQCGPRSIPAWTPYVG